jgi:hypothetical protein
MSETIVRLMLWLDDEIQLASKYDAEHPDDGWDKRLETLQDVWEKIREISEGRSEEE